MAAYVTYDQVGRFGLAAQILIKFPRADVEGAISAGASRIDSYIGQVFTLPLLAWGDDLRECNAVLAAWRLMRTKGGNPSDSHSLEALRLDYEDMIRWLERISAGNATPTDVDDSSDPVTSPAPQSPRVVSNESRGYATSNSFEDAGPFTTRRGR